MIRRPRRSTLFPYTTPFRPRDDRGDGGGNDGGDGDRLRHLDAAAARRQHQETETEGSAHAELRSEEHTSELQSQSNLVCRLLLEKKKHRCLVLLLCIPTTAI